jgi:hypothetical protein
LVHEESFHQNEQGYYPDGDQHEPKDRMVLMELKEVMFINGIKPIMSSFLPWE